MVWSVDRFLIHLCLRPNAMSQFSGKIEYVMHPATGRLLHKERQRWRKNNPETPELQTFRLYPTEYICDTHSAPQSSQTERGSSAPPRLAPPRPVTRRQWTPSSHEALFRPSQPHPLSPHTMIFRPRLALSNDELISPRLPSHSLGHVGYHSTTEVRDMDSTPFRSSLLRRCNA